MQRLLPVLAAFALLACLLTGCGEEPERAEPTPHGDLPAPAPPHSPKRVELATPDELAAMREGWQRVYALEAECVPGRGVQRDQVEARHGEGRPARLMKGYLDGPEDSPARVYEIPLPAVRGGLKEAELLVVYDELWKVKQARVLLDGIVVGGRPPWDPDHIPRPLYEQLASEQRRAEALMERVRSEIRRRFGD